MKMLKTPYFLALSLAASPVLFAQDAKEAPKVDFMKDVKPIFEGACIHCHGPNEENLEGDYRMDTKEATFKGGDAYGKDVIKIGDPKDSPVYWMTTVHIDDPKDPEAMPPEKPLNEAQQQIIHDWIAAGAPWPDGVVLEEKPRVTYQGVKPLFKKGGPFNKKQIEMIRLWAEQGADWPAGLAAAAEGGTSGPADNLDLVKKIREKIVETSKVTQVTEMKDYESVIPKTGVKFEMVAIPGGEFTMGSPDNEEGRAPSEGPQRKVKVSPFWMGKYEVTWDMYEPFMITDVARNKDGTPEKIPDGAEPVDIISAPTTPYQEMSFGMGTQGYPAICMTQHAALKFCEWLSAQTGHYYRIPTEAEWEYACRAGSTGPYSCKPEELADHAVMDPEQTRTGYEKVGTKKPNLWGLYDMHGNVLEWCLDAFSDEGYPAADGVLDNPWVKPVKLYPRTVRGGSWYDTPGLLRSAARTGSTGDWKVQDPQLPQSIWYHTDATWLGMRIVRPLEVPPAEEMFEVWNIGFAEE